MNISSAHHLHLAGIAIALPSGTNTNTNTSPRHLPGISVALPSGTKHVVGDCWKSRVSCSASCIRNNLNLENILWNVPKVHLICCVKRVLSSTTYIMFKIMSIWIGGILVGQWSPPNLGAFQLGAHPKLSPPSLVEKYHITAWRNVIFSLEKCHILELIPTINPSPHAYEVSTLQRKTCWTIWDKVHLDIVSVPLCRHPPD